MLHHFARVFVVNLDCRPDRWETFKERVPTDWPFQPVTTYLSEMRKLEMLFANHGVGATYGLAVSSLSH